MLRILYIDELRGFLKSKVIYVLIIGLPVISLLIHYFRPDTEGIPLSRFVAILIAGIGGTLSAVVLSTTITTERMNRVYDLFLVRPVQRWQLLTAKYFAIITCLIAAVAISMGCALLIDRIELGVPVADLLRNTIESLVISVAGIAIACSVGILFGILFTSVAVSAILAVYLGNQLTSIIILPTVLIEGFDPLLYSAAIGVGIPLLVMGISIALFNRKTL